MAQEADISIQSYLKKKVDLQTAILNYIDNEKNEENDFLIIQFFDDLKNQQQNFDIKKLLLILKVIIDNHHRNHDFFSKIETIILYFKEDILQTFSNSELFSFFTQNKRILIFLIENGMIQINSSILEILTQQSNLKYFLVEVETFYAGHPIKYNKENQSRYEIYEKKRKLGENDSIIAEMIRNDSVEKFITYINQNSISLNSHIKESPFETNSFLIGKNPTLIEYAAFCGSIQIFNYLKNNKVSLESSLWLYVIHSNNPELIHLLEDNHVEPEGKTYEKCIIESIICHHNNVAKYFLNYNDQKIIYLENCFDYYNYELIPNDHDSYSKYYLSVNKLYELLVKYPDFVNLLFELSYLDINLKIVLSLFQFNLVSKL